MKRKYQYKTGKKTVEREYNYIPVRYIISVFITILEIAVIGTINLDYRSLVHHFENGVWMYGCDSIKEIKSDIDDTLNKSIEIKPDTLKTGLLTRFIRAIVRIFAPML